MKNIELLKKHINNDVTYDYLNISKGKSYNEHLITFGGR
jgi:hypothetical protein